MNKHLHIVDLDVPYPPNYGAAIDMYFRIKSLHDLGVRITLHCFDYGRGHAKQLNDICEEVFYYPRKSALACAFSAEPYIVHSRRNSALFNRIFADDSPALLEGTHTCALLTDPRHKTKKIFVRMHNIEEDYYRHLAAAAPVGIAKWYYAIEANRLKRFEPLLNKATCLFSVSEKDHTDLSARFNNVVYLPPFIYNDVVQCKTGKGDYALYHGNLKVAENLKAANYLIDEVFNRLNIKLVIAGNGATELGCHNINQNIKFIESPSGEELIELIQNAHINVLPTFQSTGIKHKLINALFSGRYCVVNEIMVDGNGLDKFCYIANNPAKMRETISTLFTKEFTTEEITRRKQILEQTYSNTKNAGKLVAEIFS